MPPRPFPLPFHIGTDICQVRRIEKILFSSTPSNTGSRFASRILHPDERHAYQHRIAAIYAPPIDQTKTPSYNVFKHMQHLHTQELKAAAEFLAGRFAAKEAVIKAWWAMTHRRLPWKSICIVPADMTLQRLKTAQFANKEENPTSIQRTAGSLPELPKTRVPTPSSAPRAYVLPTDLAGKHWFDSDETMEVRISIAHDGGIATAMCIAYGYLGQREILTPRGNLRGPFVSKSIFEKENRDTEGLKEFFKDDGGKENGGADVLREFEDFENDADDEMGNYKPK